jgi:hypothetical protein
MEERNERRQYGQSIVLVAVALVALVIFAAIAVDVANTYLHRRTAQNAADAAALAGARDLARQLNECSANPDCNLEDNSWWWYSSEDTILQAMNDFAERNGIEDTDGIPGNNVNMNVYGHYLRADGLPIYDNEDNPIVIGAFDIVHPEARGVEAFAASLAPSFFGGVIGLNGISVEADSAVVFVGACADNCIFPIAPYTRTFDFGQCYNIWNGDGPGNFGWLNWTLQGNTCEQGGGACSAVCLEQNLDPETCNSGRIEVGDWVAGTVGDNNSNGIREQLRWFIDNAEPVTVPIWDYTNDGEGCGKPGSGVWYHIARFAKFQILAYQLSQGGGNEYPPGFDDGACLDWGDGPHGGNRITGMFLEWYGGEPGDCVPFDDLIAPRVIR